MIGSGKKRTVNDGWQRVPMEWQYIILRFECTFPSALLFVHSSTIRNRTLTVDSTERKWSQAAFTNQMVISKRIFNRPVDHWIYFSIPPEKWKEIECRVVNSEFERETNKYEYCEENSI